MVNHSQHRARAGKDISNLFSFTFTVYTCFAINQSKFSAEKQESDAAPIRASIFRVRAVFAQHVPRRVRVKADACAAFRMGSLMIPTTLGHSWK